MTENEKKIAKEIHDEFKIMGLNFAADVVEEKFPEAFEEPKPERVKHEQIFKYSWDGYDDDKIWEEQLTLLFKEYAKSVIIPERFDNITIKEVTELPAPEGNGWTDELVSKFVDEWESYEGKRFANCMEDFKQKNNVE